VTGLLGACVVLHDTVLVTTAANTVLRMNSSPFLGDRTKHVGFLLPWSNPPGVLAELHHQRLGALYPVSFSKNALLQTPPMHRQLPQKLPIKQHAGVGDCTFDMPDTCTRYLT
jgi:hypothetical protein